MPRCLQFLTHPLLSPDLHNFAHSASISLHTLVGSVCLSLVTKSWPILCDPMDCSPPGSSVHGILQARILEWVAIFFSRDLPDPGIEPGPHASLASVGRFFTTSTTSEALIVSTVYLQSPLPPKCTVIWNDVLPKKTVLSGITTWY